MTKSPTPILEYKHVSKSYGSKTVLKDISFSIPTGKIVGLLGQNGAGKTTLIKLANDLLTPTSGEVLVDGGPVGVASKQKSPIFPNAPTSTKLCASATPSNSSPNSILTSTKAKLGNY